MLCVFKLQDALMTQKLHKRFALLVTRLSVFREGTFPTIAFLQYRVLKISSLLHVLFLAKVLRNHKCVGQNFFQAVDLQSFICTVQTNQQDVFK